MSFLLKRPLWRGAAVGYRTRYSMRAGTRQSRCVFGADDNLAARILWQGFRSLFAPHISGFLILSFAKNASAYMSLRRNAFITVMQAAELRDLDDPSYTRDLTRKWTLLVEAQMGPRSVVVSEIRSQGSLEMLPVQDHEMVQAVSSYGADEAFGIGILPGLRGAVSTSSMCSESMRRRTSLP